MSDLVFRTEELTNNQIAELYVASDYEQRVNNGAIRIIDMSILKMELL